MSEEVLTATHDALYWQRRALQAEQREAITADAYNQQQSSYRELETLYQASQERALRAEGEAAALHIGQRAWAEQGIAAQADAAALRAELEAVRNAVRLAEHKVDQAMQGRSGALSVALWALRDALKASEA